MTGEEERSYSTSPICLPTIPHRSLTVLCHQDMSPNNPLEFSEIINWAFRSPSPFTHLLGFSITQIARDSWRIAKCTINRLYSFFHLNSKIHWIKTFETLNSRVYDAVHMIPRPSFGVRESCLKKLWIHCSHQLDIRRVSILTKEIIFLFEDNVLARACLQKGPPILPSAINPNHHKFSSTQIKRKVSST